MINTKYIKSLNPCQDRLDNWVEHYKEFESTLTAFLDLQSITYKDKIWVFFRSIPKDKIVLVAADFAEHVLHLYESKYPGDDRPRKAIEAARSGDAANAANAASAAHAAYAASAAANAASAAHAAANA